jgi:hypothetical protein
VLKLFHFGRFDIAMFLLHLGVMTTPVYCTKIASKLARTYTDRHGLKDVTRELLGVELSKAQQSSDWGAIRSAPNRWPTPPPTCCICTGLRERLNAMLEREGRMALAQASFDFLPHRAALDLAGGKMSTSSPIPEDSDGDCRDQCGRTVDRPGSRAVAPALAYDPAAAPGVAGGDHRDPDRPGRTGGLALAASGRPAAGRGQDPDPNDRAALLWPVRRRPQFHDHRPFSFEGRQRSDERAARRSDPDPWLRRTPAQPGDGEVGDLSRRHDEAGLSGDVRIDDGGGYRFASEQAVVDTKTGVISGETSMLGEGPTGQVQSNAYTVYDKGDRVVFRGGVRTRLERK